MNRQAPLRQTADATSAASRWTARWFADQRRMLLAGIASDQRLLWLSPVSQPVAADHAIVDLRPAVPPVLTGDLTQTAGDWPFLDDSLDQVVLQHVGETWLDPAVLIDQALRVLRPEGSLWWFGCGWLGWPRLRIAWAESERSQVVSAVAPSAWRRRLADRGCVDIVAYSLRRDAESGNLVAVAGAGWTSPWVMLHARKRRVATILSVRRGPAFKAPPLRALGPSPASRSGLAA